MLVSDLINDVKVSTRQNSTELDAFLLAAAGRLYRDYLRNENWPQQRVTGVTLSVVSGTSAYDLPADFDRFAGDRVNYNFAGMPNWSAILIPIVLRGTTQGDRTITVWEGVSTLQYASQYPAIAAVSPGGANTYQLVLYPPPGTSGDTVTLDYYSVPASVTLSTVLIQPLYETLVAALSREKARFLNDTQNLEIFAQQEKASYRNARMTLNAL